MDKIIKPTQDQIKQKSKENEFNLDATFSDSLYLKIDKLYQQLTGPTKRVNSLSTPLNSIINNGAGLFVLTLPTLIEERKLNSSAYHTLEKIFNFNSDEIYNIHQEMDEYCPTLSLDNEINNQEKKTKRIKPISEDHKAYLLENLAQEYYDKHNLNKTKQFNQTQSQRFPYCSDIESRKKYTALDTKMTLFCEEAIKLPGIDEHSANILYHLQAEKDDFINIDRFKETYNFLRDYLATEVFNINLDENPDIGLTELISLHKTHKNKGQTSLLNTVRFMSKLSSEHYEANIQRIKESGREIKDIPFSYLSSSKKIVNNRFPLFEGKKTRKYKSRN